MALQASVRFGVFSISVLGSIRELSTREGHDGLDFVKWLFSLLCEEQRQRTECGSKEPRKEVLAVTKPKLMAWLKEGGNKWIVGGGY